MPDQPEMPKKSLDEAYGGFPAPTAWASEAVDWELSPLVSSLESRRTTLTAESLRQAVEVSLRAAALDTGAIEGLYSTDRGLTITVATQAAAWQQVLDERGEDARRFFEAQLDAYEHILDAATKAVEITEVWVRQLHSQICRNQTSVRVQTAIGEQDQEFIKGEYKRSPNHVQLPGGGTFSYAPVIDTPAEMQRYVELLRTSGFRELDAVWQAAWAHYAFVRIHPFQDGNGRVARAIASLFLIRSFSVPLVIFADQKPSYLAALRSTDAGRPSALGAFFADCVRSSLEVTLELLGPSELPRVDAAKDAFRALYLAEGGLKHSEVDLAAYRLVSRFSEIFAELRSPANLPGEVEVEHVVESVETPAGNSEFRVPVSKSGRRVRVSAKTAPPAGASTSISFFVQIRRTDGLLMFSFLAGLRGAQAFQARLADCHPTLSAAVEIRLRAWANNLLGAVLTDLHRSAKNKLKQTGY